MDENAHGSPHNQIGQQNVHLSPYCKQTSVFIQNKVKQNTRLFLYTDHVDLLSIYIQNNVICLTEQYLRKRNSNKATIKKFNSIQ